MDKTDMTLIENRLDLINRYNNATGLVCNSIDRHQVRFIAGEMDADEVAAFVRLCEYFIATMESLGLD